MSPAPADAEKLDEDHGSAIPEPPRRVPFGVVVTTSLLGLLSLTLLVTALVTLTGGSSFRPGVGEATAQGLAAALIAVGGALVAAVAWSFVRDGITAGPMIVGGLTLLAGLILLATGVAGTEPDTDPLRLGVLALVIGVGVLLVPLLGHAPAYLAARRVWSRAERDWLHDLSTPETPPAGYAQQWPGHYPPPQQYQQYQQYQQWNGAPQPQYAPQPGHPPQPGLAPQPGFAPQPGHPAQPGFPAQPGYPDQYQFPPQHGQGWTAPQPQQYQAWPEAAVPQWSDQQPSPQPLPTQADSAPAQADIAPALGEARTEIAAPAPEPQPAASPPAPTSTA